MKTIIAGGRDYSFTAVDKHMLNQLRKEIPITEVVCGMARGADTCGFNWAKEHNIPVKEFPADWKNLGKAAGHVRNKQMAEYAQVLIAFPGGKGTASMIDYAHFKKLRVWDIAKIRGISE